MVNVSWTKADKMCSKLAKKVKSKFKPDVIIGVSRGGLVPLRLLSDYLDVKQIGVVGVKFYAGVGKTSAVPIVTQKLNVNVAGKKVLVVDDVADSGATLNFVVKMLKRKKAKVVKVATLHFKPSSKFTPDFFISKTSEWIVYPWEKD